MYQPIFDNENVNPTQLPVKDRPAVMGAIKTLTRYGHDREAELLWSKYISPYKVNTPEPLLPGESQPHSYREVEPAPTTDVVTGLKLWRGCV